jgi:hypothetical protein
VQKTDDVVAVVERIIGKVQSKSEGKDFTFPYDLRARRRAETDGQKETHLLSRENTHILLSLSVVVCVSRDV